MPTDDLPLQDHLSPGAAFLLRSVRDQIAAPTPPATAFPWLLAILERRGAMAADIRPGLDPDALTADLRSRISGGDGGPPLTLESLIEAARAEAGGDDAPVKERHLVATAVSIVANDAPAGPDPGNRKGRTSAGRSQPGAESGADPDIYVPRTQRPTPTLDRHGADLTAAAAAGKLATILGRATEIEQMVQILCRRTKRNPALVGPAGVGKTALVEGLAQRIVARDVPEALLGARLIALQPTSLVAGSGVVGQLEERLEAILEEANQDGLLLFIDEVHSLIGAGGQPGRRDVASQLKPALARGEIACIVATTDMEYNRDIKPDGALERRFNPVKVNELSGEDTLAILQAVATREREQRQVTVPDAVLERIVRLADRYLRARHFPDKALDLLDQCVAAALTQGRSAVTAAEVRDLVERRVGMPTDLAGGVERLNARLEDASGLSDEERMRLIDRLRTSLRDLDVAPQRPDAVVLAVGEAARQVTDLARTIAEELYGDARRLVRLDLSRYVNSADITNLTGSSAGYVGHGDALPHDPLQQMPWSVVLWENAHACHPQIRTLLAQILETGSLQDARGQTTHFSETIVLMAVPVDPEGSAIGRRVGFEVGPPTPPGSVEGAPASDLAVRALGPQLGTQVDLVLSRASSHAHSHAAWLQASLLGVLASRYSERGLYIRWDPTFVTWLQSAHPNSRNVREYEQVLDRSLNPQLIHHLHEAKTGPGGRVVVRAVAGEVVVEPETHEEDQDEIRDQ
jgi:ATP-dependent Clp protease ATP-binding subunit ClpC